MSVHQLNLRQAILPTLPQPPAPIAALRQLPDWKRLAAADRLAMVRPALDKIEQGLSVNAAVDWLIAQFGRAMLPSKATLKRYIEKAKTGDVAELAPGWVGRQRKEYGWELRAQRLYASPQKRMRSTVALMLRKEGWSDATDSRVARYLRTLPSNATETAPGRVGQHFYKQNIKPHVVRDASVLPVGLVYQGDGHTCDFYVAHPATGKPFRPELTPWLDVRSQYPVSWWLSESESAHTTLFSLSAALVDHDHVPAFAHTDPGSGFTARMIDHKVSGWLARFDIEAITALPGNARGKGLMEGWFHWFEERCGKQFETYCGHCRTDDALRRLEHNIARGKIYLPSWDEGVKAIRDYMESYKHTPKASLGDRTPAEVWRELERVPLVTPAEAIVRPREIRKVVRWGVELHNRLYRAAELAQYEGREVLVEYSVANDAQVWILDKEGRWICDAVLVQKQPWLPASRIEEAKQRRLEGQKKRLQRHLDEAEARSRMPIETASLVQQIAAPVDVEAIQADVAEQIEQQAQHAWDTPEHRFSRWLELDAQRDSLSDHDAMWLRSYEGTSEFRGQKLVHDAFADDQTKGPAGTGPEENHLENKS